MSAVYGDSDYTGNSIISSRILQEEFSLNQGVTAYGVLANFIGLHMSEIDKMAEYMGEYFSQRDIEKRYVEQYGKNKVSGTINRFFTDDRQAYQNQRDRRDFGFLKATAVEGGIKVGARLVQKWLGEKEKYNCLSEVYTILLSYAGNDRPINENAKVIRELTKIRRSFPISKSAKEKLSQINVDNLNIFATDFAILETENNQALKEGITYLLYVLYAQKYGDSTEHEGHLLEYYDFLGYRSLEAQELLRENKNAYDTITTDQSKYLILARGMLKNLEPSIPDIDVRSIAIRTAQMAENDPYRVRRKKVVRPYGSESKRISDLFFESPFVVINAGATALAQLELNDETKDKIGEQMMNWGLDDEAIDNIMGYSENMKKESEENKEE